MSRPLQSPWLDSHESYGHVTRVMHWAIAALILWQFVGMGLRLALGRVPVVSFFVGLHQPVGALILALVMIRALWAVLNRRHRPHHGKAAFGAAAKLGHLALYALMLIVPALALLRSYGSGRGFSPFGIPLLPATGTEVTWMVAPANVLHGPLAWVLLTLILGHVAMVALHERLWRDGTLRRMAGPRQRPAASASSS